MAGFGNGMVSAVLRSPLHGLVSRSLALFTYRGRRSGTEYTIPVGYVERGGSVLVLAGRPEGKNWWKNFAEPSPVTLRLRGRSVSGTAVLLDGERAEEAVAHYFELSPRTARTFGVSADADPVWIADRVRVIEVTRDSPAA